MPLAPISPPRVFTLHREIPSQNVRDRWHWRSRHADRRAWMVWLRCCMREPAVKPSCHMYVKITSKRAKLIADYANYVGGAKGLVDALVEVGLLRDDSDKWATITYHQEEAVRKHQRCTVVEIGTGT